MPRTRRGRRRGRQRWRYRAARSMCSMAKPWRMQKAGALWFYELVRPGHQYASGTITFAGSPVFGGTTLVSLGGTTISHVNLIGDTATTIANCFALLVNAGSTGVWAKAEGATLTITSRTMGAAGNGIPIGAT